MNAEIISTLLMIVGGVTILTNIIVQVVKSITWDKIPTNLVALFVAEALTLAAGGAPIFKAALTVPVWAALASMLTAIRQRLQSMIPRWKQKVDAMAPVSAPAITVTRMKPQTI